VSLAQPVGRLRAGGADAREALVAALEGVQGLTAYPSAPDQAVAGAAWPKWVQTTYTGHLCDSAVDTWEVFATLPADYAPTTVDEGDELRDLVAPVLVRLGPVAYAEPVAIAFRDNQSMPGIRLRMTTTR
jgi:hypothetical protein